MFRKRLDNWTLQILRTAIQNMIHLRFFWGTFHSTLHSPLLVSHVYKGDDVAQYFRGSSWKWKQDLYTDRLLKGPYRKICCNAYRLEFFWLKVFRLQKIHQIKSASKMPLSRSNGIKLFFKWASSCLPTQRWNYKAVCIAIFTKKLIRNLLQQNVSATDQKKFTYDLRRFGHSHQTSTLQEELNIRSATTMKKTIKDASYFKSVPQNFLAAWNTRFAQ